MGREREYCGCGGFRRLIGVMWVFGEDEYFVFEE